MRIKIEKKIDLKADQILDGSEPIWTVEYNVDPKYFKKPQVGSRFNVRYWSTSQVQEIIDDSTFKTVNSVYRWEVIDDNQIIKRLLFVLLSWIPVSTAIIVGITFVPYWIITGKSIHLNQSVKSINAWWMKLK